MNGNLFFLAPDGRTNSLHEMQATYHAMFLSDIETQKKTQCQFMARREFFKSQSSENLKIWPCPERDKWLEELNPQGISLIFATGYLSSAASSFGHTFLKLKNPKNKNEKEILDYSVNFAARTTNTSGALYALYGLFGFFPGTFGMSPFHQMTKEYTHLEGRDIWEYELNFSPAEAQLLVFHLLELEGSSFDYYFLDDNCSFFILKALEVARPGLHLVGDDELFLIPIDSVKKARSLIIKRNYRPSLETIWKEQYSRLSSDQIKKIKNEDWQEADLQTIEAGQDYLTKRLFEETLAWREKNFLLSKERAKRSNAISSRDSLLQDLKDKALPPEEGPDSSRISLGYSQGDERHLQFGFHFAFHDELSRNQGATLFSQLQVLSFDFQSQEMQNILLKKYRILDILSTSAIDQFDWPLSWGLSAGGEAVLKDPTHMQNHLFGELGYSFDLFREKMRLSPLLKLGLSENDSEIVQPSFGINTRLWVLWNSEIRSLINYKDLQMKSLRQQSFQVQQAMDLTRQLELRIAWKQSRFNDRQESESLINLWQNFLF